MDTRSNFSVKEGRQSFESPAGRSKIEKMELDREENELGLFFNGKKWKAM